jgi:SAM-dependent methyltransferase
VTGIDISEEMVEIARGRVAAIPEPIGVGASVQAEFHAMSVHEMPWEAEFDAAILYDAMHHFHDEAEALGLIRRTLTPGGQIYIHEGVRPEPGSAGERMLIEEMEQYGTLEAPFDSEYLVEVIERAGFVEIRRLVEIDALYDVAGIRAARDNVTSLLRYPGTNTIIALNPVAAELAGLPPFRASIEAVGPWEERSGGRVLARRIRVTNAGRSHWTIGRSFPFPMGSVTVGAYAGSGRHRVEMPRGILPNALGHGDSAEVEIIVPRDLVDGQAEVVVDLVREQVSWFEAEGSQPLVLALEQTDA